MRSWRAARVEEEDMTTADPYELIRFVAAQEGAYAAVLNELGRGRKEAHWMWFIFPQIVGLGNSVMAERYAISGVDEARAYLAHPILGPRLQECAEAVLAVECGTAEAILGHPDCLKLRSCVTLFDLVSPPGSVFRRVLDRFYNGQSCELTRAIVQRG